MWSGRGKWWSGGERVDASHGAWSQLVTMASVPRAAFSRSLSGVSFFLLFILPLTLFFSFFSFVDLCILSFLPIPFLSLFFLLLILLFFFLTFFFPFLFFLFLFPFLHFFFLHTFHFYSFFLSLIYFLSFFILSYLLPFTFCICSVSAPTLFLTLT